MLLDSDGIARESDSLRQYSRRCKQRYIVLESSLRKMFKDYRGPNRSAAVRGVRRLSRYPSSVRDNKRFRDSGRSLRSGRNQVCKSGRDGSASRLAKSLDHAGKGFKRPCPALVAGTMRYFAGDHGGTQFAFGPVVGRLDAVLKEESQQIASILLSAHSVQQPPIIVVAQNPIAQMLCEFLLEFLCPLPYSAASSSVFAARSASAPFSRSFSFRLNSLARPVFFSVTSAALRSRCARHFCCATSTSSSAS